VVVKEAEGWSPDDPDFGFRLACAMEGMTLFDDTFVLAHGESWSYADVHAAIGAAWDGATCTITETETHGATSVRIRDGSTWLDVTANAATFTLATAGTGTQTITVRNEREGPDVLPKPPTPKPTPPTVTPTPAPTPPTQVLPTVVDRRAEVAPRRLARTGWDTLSLALLAAGLLAAGAFGLETSRRLSTARPGRGNAEDGNQGSPPKG
jgi:hypothetical protein